MGIAVKLGINTTLAALKMKISLSFKPHEMLPIFNATLVVFIPNFTATHAITSANLRYSATLPKGMFGSF